MLSMTLQGCVSFDESGLMDMKYVDNLETLSTVYNDLRSVSLHPETVFVEVAQGFEYSRNGLYEYQEFSLDEKGPEGLISSVNDLCTGEIGYIGTTIFPNGRNKQSVDGNYHVVVNSNLTLDGQSQCLGHELLGHIFLFFKTADYDMSTHNFVGNKDYNFPLVVRIISIVNEIYENQKHN